MDKTGELSFHVCMLMEKQECPKCGDFVQKM